MQKDIEQALDKEIDRKIYYFSIQEIDLDLTLTYIWKLITVGNFWNAPQ